MGLSPDPAKQISPRSLFFSLIMLIFCLTVLAWIVWQVVGLRAQPLPDELRQAKEELDHGSVNVARKRFDSFISREGKIPVTYIQVMQICNKCKKYELSRDYGAIGLDACKEDSREGRALLNLAMGETYAAEEEPHPQPRALSYARRAFELDKDNPDVLNMYGYLLADNAVSQAQVDEALVHLDRALQILRGRVESGVLGITFGSTRAASPFMLALTEDSYGWALYRRGKFVPADKARAADALELAVSDLPTEPADPSLKAELAEAAKILYYHLGAAEHAAGRTKAATNALNVALLYDPKYADVRRELEALSSETFPLKSKPNPNPEPAIPPKSTEGVTSGMSTVGGGSPPQVPATVSHSSGTVSSPSSPPLKGKDGRNVFTPLPRVGEGASGKSK